MTGDTAFQPTPFTIHAGNLCVRLAENQAELEAAQRLRYDIFFGEMGARPTPEQAEMGLDFDRYDPFCEHLLVMDNSDDGKEKVVGTYRLLRRSRLPAGLPFYTESEFDITPLKAVEGEILELGRSCVQAEYRNRAVMQLLWRGIGEYVAKLGVKVMFGCASFHGTDPDVHAAALSYLCRKHLAPEELRPRAQGDHYVHCNRLPEGVPLDDREALRQLPALIKGYLRLNGFIGDGAYVDEEFNTIDVCIVVKTELVTQKYATRYVNDPSDDA